MSETFKIAVSRLSRGTSESPHRRLPRLMRRNLPLECTHEPLDGVVLVVICGPLPRGQAPKRRAAARIRLPQRRPARHCLCQT